MVMYAPLIQQPKNFLKAWTGIYRPCKEDTSRALHPTTWRPWWAFGCGGLGDIGCHTIDTAYWALGLGAPEAVEVDMAEAANPIHTPNGSIVTYKFPARGGKSAVDVKWYEGPRMPKAPKGLTMRSKAMAVSLWSEKKAHLPRRHAPQQSPPLSSSHGKNTKKIPPSVLKTLERVGGIHRDFVNCIRNGGKTCSDFIMRTTYRSHSPRYFGNSYWQESPMGCENLKIKGNKEASALIEVEARKGWEHPIWLKAENRLLD